MDQEGVSVEAVAVKTNGLGLAGFVCSLVGLCSGGLLSPIGLILSLVALKDEPRGFAIAGVILGVFGSCGILITILFFPAMILGVLGAAGIAALAGPQIEAGIEMGVIGATIEANARESSDGAYPSSLDELDLDSGMLTDGWDNAYQYEVLDDGAGYRIWSLGEDGVDGTSDDIVTEVRRGASGGDADVVEPEGEAADEPM